MNNRNTKFPMLIFFLMRIGLKIKRIKNNPKIIRKFLSSVNILKDMKVLDFGCGQGDYAIEASKIVGEKGKVIAVDIYKGMIDDLISKIKKFTINNIKPIHITSISKMISKSISGISFI